MTVRAIVSKEILFQQLNEHPVIKFFVGTLIEYERWKRPTDGRAVITIKHAFGEYSKYEYLGPDFPIENFVEPIEETPLSKMNREIQESIEEQEEYTRIFNLGMEAGKSMKEEEPYTVQVEMRSSRHDLNKYLKTIPGKNVIDIKPMENNCYLVIYKEYEE